MNHILKSFLVSSIILLVPVVANAADFGTTGLIDIPSARMMNDGEFKIAMSRQTVADIYSLNYQVTPWLESTFRYTIFNPDNVSGSGITSMTGVMRSNYALSVKEGCFRN